MLGHKSSTFCFTKSICTSQTWSTFSERILFYECSFRLPSYRPTTSTHFLYRLTLLVGVQILVEMPLCTSCTPVSRPSPPPNDIAQHSTCYVATKSRPWPEKSPCNHFSPFPGYYYYCSHFFLSVNVTTSVGAATWPNGYILPGPWMSDCCCCCQG